MGQLYILLDKMGLDEMAINPHNTSVATVNEIFVTSYTTIIYFL